jgi:hypothetical protein
VIERIADAVPELNMTEGQLKTVDRFLFFIALALALAIYQRDQSRLSDILKDLREDTSMMSTSIERSIDRMNTRIDQMQAYEGRIRALEARIDILHGFHVTDN